MKTLMASFDKFYFSLVEKYNLLDLWFKSQTSVSLI